MYLMLQEYVCILCYKSIYVSYATRVCMYLMLHKYVCILCYKSTYVSYATRVCILCYKSTYVSYATRVRMYLMLQFLDALRLRCQTFTGSFTEESVKLLSIKNSPNYYPQEKI